MSDNKKYYYLRLKDSFFDSEEMQLLESIQDGYLYSNILLKLYLISLKDEGRLMLKGVIPYNTQMLATLTKHSVGTIEKALTIFKQLQLIEVLDNGAIYMLNVQDLIGRSSSEADRKKEYRVRIEKEKLNLNDRSLGQMSGQKSDEHPPEIEIEIEIDKEINKKEYKEKEPTLSAKRKSFVVPTVEEVSAYCKERNNNIDAQYFWDYQSSRGWLIGKAPMKDWKAAIRTFEKNSFNYAKAKNPTNKVRCRDEKDFGNIGGVIDLDGMPEGGIPF